VDIQLSNLPVVFLASFLASAALATLLVLKQKLGLRIGMDGTEGVQKLHRFPVPRLGGVAVSAALVFGWILLGRPPDLGLVLLAALPAWIWGLSEDLTRSRSPLSRLLATLASGLLLAQLSGLPITRLDLPLDPFIPALGWLLLTSFAVAGLSNAINIVDGVNGLASFTAAAMFACLALLAHDHGDMASLRMALLGCAAALGFFLVNWPHGRLFLGDGGAYLLGFWLGATAISLVHHNADITAWFALALFAYPVTETVFSWYRRTMHHGVSAAVPDRLHLHSLVYARRSRWRRLALLPWITPNSATLIRLLPMVLIPPAGAYFAAGSLALSVSSTMLTVALYLAWFARLVKLRKGRRPIRPHHDTTASAQPQGVPSRIR